MTSIEDLDPFDDAQLAAYHSAYRAAFDDEWDHPFTALELRAELRQDPTYTTTRAVVARDARGRVVATGSAEMPRRDNLDVAYVEVCVVPEHRRLGHGTAVLERLQAIVSAEGRHTMIAQARWDVGAEGSGRTAFAEARGFTLDLADAHRVLRLPAVMPDAPVRDGYTVVTWRGRCPDEWVDQYANLLTLIVQEAPSGEYALENELFDAGRVRADEELLAVQDRTMQVAAAVSRAGELAGHTQLVFPRTDPEVVFQWDTLVLPDHRGHGLGLSLKVRAMEESTDLLAGRRLVHTYNAASNGPMIAVNEAMGFRQVSWLGEYVRTTH